MAGSRRRSQLDRATDAALVASRALVAVAARSMSELDDVTIPQYRALVLLASRGPTTSGDLAARLGVHASTVTRLADRLVDKGLVARSTATDRREVLVALTRHGAALLEAVTTARRSQLSDVMRRIPPAERARVVEAFTAFAAAAGEIPDDEWSVVLADPLPD